MAKFKDTDGKEYTVVVRYAEWDNVERETGVDLNGDFLKTWERFEEDPRVFVNVLFHLLKGQHDGNPAAFAERLDGDVLEAARVAVVDAVTDFFPKLKREAAKKMVTKANVFRGEIAAKAMVVMDELAADQTAKLRSASSESFGSVLESLVSETRTAAPSGK